MQRLQEVYMDTIQPLKREKSLQKMPKMKTLTFIALLPIPQICLPIVKYMEKQVLRSQLIGTSRNNNSRKLSWIEPSQTTSREIVEKTPKIQSSRYSRLSKLQRSLIKHLLLTKETQAQEKERQYRRMISLKSSSKLTDL